MKSSTTTTTTTTTILVIDRYSKVDNGGSLHASQGDAQLIWQHLTEPHMELRIISTAPSGRSKPKGKASTNESLAQIQLMVAHRRALSSNGELTMLENLDLNKAALLAPLESGGAPIKALTKGLSIGFKYILESQATRVRFTRKDDIDKVRNVISSLIPFKDAAASIPPTQTGLHPQISTINNSQQSLSQQPLSTPSHFHGFAQPLGGTPYASPSQRTSTATTSMQWQSLTLPPIRNRQESFQNQPFILPPPTPPSSMPATADFSDPQSGQGQSSQAVPYSGVNFQCVPAFKRARLDSGSISSDDMDIIEDDIAITQSKRRRLSPLMNSQATQTNSPDTACASVNTNEEIADFVSSTDTDAVKYLQDCLADPEFKATVSNSYKISHSNA